MPLLIWNIFDGVGVMFHKNSGGCWLYLFTVATSYTNCWIMLSLACTRFVSIAIFRPHKYDEWLRDAKLVRWLLYATPWVLGFCRHIAFGPVLRFYTAGIDLASGGLCVYAPLSASPQDLANDSLQALFSLVMQTMAPLFLCGALYGAVFVKLVWERRRIRPTAAGGTIVVEMQMAKAASSAHTVANGSQRVAPPATKVVMSAK